jgi:hypothetical protein
MCSAWLQMNLKDTFSNVYTDILHILLAFDFYLLQIQIVAKLTLQSEITLFLYSCKYLPVQFHLHNHINTDKSKK